MPDRPLSPGARSLLRLLRQGATLALRRNAADPWGLPEVEVRSRLGKEVRLTHPHAWVVELIQAGRLTEEPEDSGCWVAREEERAALPPTRSRPSPPLRDFRAERRRREKPRALREPVAPLERPVAPCPVCGRPAVYDWSSGGSYYVHQDGSQPDPRPCYVPRDGHDPNWGLGKG